ncbi:MAG: hypothetical protein KDA47_25155, partial [Planctomycetales bacterium]|nr:hypothetical protein [Planctomycetales bacterium]
MRKLVAMPILAVVFAVMMANTSWAAFCGATCYRNCGACAPANYCCAKQQCHTVMKTCREVV